MARTLVAEPFRGEPRSSRVVGLIVLGAVVGLLVGGGDLGMSHPFQAPPTRHVDPGPLPLLSAGAADRTDAGPSPVERSVTSSLSTPPEWINVTPTGHSANPPAGAYAVMAYDPIDHESIYFGGCSKAQCPGNQTWAYANGTWTNLTDWKGAPPARYGAVMDYDPNMPGVLLFGGHSGAVVTSYLNDTWLFRGGLWTNLTGISPMAPPPREFASMAFDPDAEENGSVLFGGHVFSFGDTNDTWIWQGWAGWTLLGTSSSPPASESASMAYDPLLQAIVLYGCGNGCTIGGNWTWELYSGQWWRVGASPPVGSARVGSVMTWDPSLSAVVLFGGYDYSGYLGDSWTFSGSAWRQLPSLATDPNGRYAPAMSTDSSSFPPILFGGSRLYPYILPPLNDTWVFEVPPTVSLVTPAAAEASAPVNFTLTVANGTAPYSALVGFGDGAHALYPLTGASITVSHTYLSPGVYYPFVNVSDAAGVLRFGGAAAGTGLSVSAGPSLGPLPPISPTDVNHSIAFVGSTVSSGHAPFSFTWHFGDGASASGQNTNHAYTTPGTYGGDLSISDASGGSSDVGFEAIVNPLPALTLATSPTAPVAAAATTLYGNVTGGTPPYTYSWAFGDGGTSALPFPSHNFTTSGAYPVGLWVNDSVGGSVHRTMTLTVGTAHPPNPKAASAPAGVPAWFWPGVVGLVVVGAVGSYALWRRGRTDTGR